MKKYLYLCIFILSSYSSFSQERMGICNSIYAGINGLWINPASIADSPFEFDINIVSFSQFIDNNDVYLYRANIPTLLKNINNSVDVYNVFNVRHGITSKIMLYDKYNSDKKTVYQSLLLEGPSVMFKFRKWNFALTDDIRDGLSLIGANNKLAKVAFEGMTYEPLSHQYIYIPDFRIDASAWAELGLSAATYMKINDKILKFGISYKYLMGFSNVYFHNRSTTMIYQNDDDMDFYYLNADYGHSIPQSKVSLIGTGNSVDLGVSYQKLILHKHKEFHKYYYDEGEDCEGYCKPNPYLLYKWKVGFSLLDIGYITCKKDAKTYVFTDANTTWFHFAHWAPDGLDGIDKDLNTQFANDSLAKPYKTKYSTLLPMAASIQYDYYVSGDFYINYTIIQRIPQFNTPGIRRENILAITPRIDKQNLGIAFPLVFYQYIYPHIGFCLRLGNYLIIGSDKLGGFFNDKFSGMDIYFSLKFNILNKCK